MSDNDDGACNNLNYKNTNNLKPALMKSINKIIQGEGYVTYSMYVKDVFKKGENYLSDLKEVDIKGETIEENKETYLFIKERLPGDIDIILSKDLFLHEIFVYTELAYLFHELQNEFNVPDAEKYNFVKFYNSGYEDLLIFDNMSRKDFKTYSRFDTMPLEALMLSVKELAKFHGFSMFLKQYKPDFYKNTIQELKYPLVLNDNSGKFFTTTCNITLEYLEDDKRMKLEKYIPGLLNKFTLYLIENKGKIKCLCHGDYRMNNILVKEMDDEVAAVIPVDYQGVYYGSPLRDVFYMMFMSTDRQLRKNYMEDIQNIYYKSLTEYLRHFMIDVESVYPQEEFEKDLKDQVEFGLISSLIFLPFAMAAENNIPEINDDDVKTMKMHVNFKSRFEGIIDDFIEWGYL